MTRQTTGGEGTSSISGMSSKYPPRGGGGNKGVGNNRNTSTYAASRNIPTRGMMLSNNKSESKSNRIVHINVVTALPDDF